MSFAQLQLILKNRQLIIDNKVVRIQLTTTILRIKSEKKGLVSQIPLSKFEANHAILQLNLSQFYNASFKIRNVIFEMPIQMFGDIV